VLTPPDAEQDALATLLSRSPSTKIVWGLERIRSMLASSGEPQRAFHSILIGGTNGKGSVAVMAESLLRGHGLHTGLYTSPHLVDASERIRIDGGPIDPDLLQGCASDILPLAEREGATFFESITAVALLAFARAGVEQAVVEVGLGGRLDATNALTPDACVITNIALDHADYLGDTLEQIAREKAGIVKSGIPVVAGTLPRRLHAIVADRAAALSAPLTVLGRDVRVERVVTGLAGTEFTYRSPTSLDLERFRVPLPGEHQAANGALALAVVEAAGHALDPVRSRAALAEVSWPGRFQVLDRPDGMVVLDVAHNPAGARALDGTLTQIPLPEPVVGLIGILGDKPWHEMLEPVLRHTTAAVFTIPPSAPHSRIWNPEEARRSVSGHEIEVIPDFDRALSRARELAGGGTVLVTGSSHTVGDALRVLSDETATAGIDEVPGRQIETDSTEGRA
jgi:dihydrofolate synthase/folylpolyglutamate synthase